MPIAKICGFNPRFKRIRNQEIYMSAGKTKIDKDLLEEFMIKFYGYGKLKSDYWFVGMEEGGGNSFDEIIARLNIWKKHGKPTLLDNHEFHKDLFDEMGRSGNFEKAWGKYQRTWGGLIKILLSYENENSPTLQEVKTFQTEKLGANASNNCIVELFPLPSPSTNKFHDFKSAGIDIDYLTSRDSYKSYLKDQRINLLRDLIAENTPKFVIFYSSTPEYIGYWCKISGASETDFRVETIQEINQKKLTARFYKTKRTCFAIIHHPTYTGVSNEYFKVTGKRIRQILNN